MRAIKSPFEKLRHTAATGVMAFTLAITNALPTAIANETADPVTTGSISANGSAVSQKGSAGFQSALGLLDKDVAGAYGAAKALPNDLERRLVQWSAIYLGDGEIDHNSVERFAADAPDFARPSFLKRRIEQALNKTEVSHAEAIRILGGEMPRTLDAQLTLARAYVADGQMDRAGRIIKSIWINNFIDAAYEAKIRQEFGRLLTREDYWNRAVHLLMHDRATGTERILDQLTPAQRSLARARIAVARKSKSAPSLIDKVDPSYRDHPMFHFNRGQYARDNGRLAEAVSHLDKVSGTPPDSAEYWYERRLISRRALARGDFQTAYAAAAGYKEGPEGRVVDANFHAGWIAFSYLNKPDLARQHFEKMRALSTLSGTVTQSHYWLGRSHKALGQTEAARAAFEIAGKYNTLYYGQLARLELGITSVGLRALPEWKDSVSVFEQRSLTRAVKLLAANGRRDLAEILMRHLARQLQTAGEMVLGARLAQSFDAHNIAILIADTAYYRGHGLDVFHYPKDGLPQQANLAKMDKAAIYAVAWQESRFDADAVSHAGARGLMQLMPGTAKDVARRVGVAYSPKKLDDPAYNARLGSTYLAGQLDRYDGSLVLAAAAYNGGSGNVNKWLKTFGDPRNSAIDVVSWIETIPFVETRKYVQRVFGSYMVYRARLGTETQTIAQALRRIPHE